ncbi:MAG: diguanylate cyclase [Gammaproteobacteria bacterium]|jgi:GGDEF domain-containing protein|nr:diguanylate cyclase [Gammaproteobacteria bacterium]MDH3846144.1 diguanylate cyclase [Gammaproteobacteria bacterium]MDH3952617.1 diguanylate cyclase [Gammaproteobacteria bacterium]MDH4003995.1 diguanylate cyclase [Gammaproteobacteria bacterium]NCF60423.1 diguanylate cyclase [Gammaproteobacteria bacterium]
MKPGRFKVLWLLMLTASLSGCPSTTGLKQTADADAAQTSSGIFACESSYREQRFMDAAADMGVSSPDAGELYVISGGARSDVVTGFAPAQDRGSTVKRALAAVAGKPDLNAFYVEVDIQNLGGLNNELGHSKADSVFARMTAIAERHIQGLESDSCSFRHGGDEFSFVVIGPGATKAEIEAALAQADTEIREYIADQGLSEIPHPKHPGDRSKQGAGIIFAVSRIGGQETVEEVYGAADKIVEARKSQ